MFDGTLLDLSGILTIAEGNESLLLKRPTSNFPSLFLMSKSKKLASYSSIFSLPRGGWLKMTDEKKIEIS